MKNWKIGIRIAAGFAAVIVIAMALGIFAYSRIGVINQNAVNISAHSLPSVYIMGKLHANVVQVVRLVLQRAIATDKADQAQIEAELAAVKVQTTEMLAKYEKELLSNE